MIGYRFCPRCATPLVVHDEEPGNPHVRCPKCAFAKWNNPLPTTIGLVVRDSEVLLLKRAIEPKEGEWDTVGGFLAPGECAEDCLQREALEEIGSTLWIDELLGTFSSVYGDAGPITVGIAFVCRIRSDSVRLSAENSAYSWFPLDDHPEVAFQDVSKALDRLRTRSRAQT